VATGTVKWFDDVQGYGFIRPTDNHCEVWVHKTAVQQSNLAKLAQGDKVEYDLKCSRWGTLTAVNLKVRHPEDVQAHK
jgi:cold shock protein